MDASCFDVNAFVFVEINPSDPQNVKKILVPGALLEFDESCMVVLKRQRQLPKLSKNIPILMAVTTDLKDFRVLDYSLPQERIYAHAVALRSTDTHLSGDQFFLINCLPRSLEVAKYFEVEAVNLRTGQIKFVPTAALMFYLHAKVVKEFEWSQYQNPV